MQLTVSLSATVAVVVVVVMATILLRAVPVPAQAVVAQQPAAPPEPEVAPLLQEQPVQIIRAGSGCIACPGERQPTGIQDAAS